MIPSEDASMTELRCKHCGSGSFVRNGMAAGHQRYRCKACGRNFTATPGRGKPPAMEGRGVRVDAVGDGRRGRGGGVGGGRGVGGGGGGRGGGEGGRGA